MPAVRERDFLPDTYSSRDLTPDQMCGYDLHLRRVNRWDVALAPFSSVPLYRFPAERQPSGAIFLSEEEANRYYTQIYPDMLRTWIEQGNDPRHVFVGEPHHQTILDFGCGTGQMTGKLTGSNEVYGVDISDALLAHANEQGLKTEVVDIDKQRLPFRDGMFDIVYSFDVLEHVFSVENALTELHRVLKPRGLLMITTPVLQPDTMDNNEVFHRSTVQQLGIEDALAASEPEVNIHGYYEWIDLLTNSRFSLLSRPVGYEWNVPMDEQLAYMRGLPACAPNVFIMAQKNGLYALDTINWRIGAGGWSFPEMDYGFGKIAPSEAMRNLLDRQPLTTQ